MGAIPMYGVLASQVKSDGKPLLLTVAEDDGSGRVLRAHTDQPQYRPLQRWRRFLGCGPYSNRGGLFRFGYVFVNESHEGAFVMAAVSAPSGQQGGVVRMSFYGGGENKFFIPKVLWGIRMPDQETQVAEIIAVQSTDSTLYVLDIANGEVGAEVITWPSHGGDNQRWVFIPE